MSIYEIARYFAELMAITGTVGAIALIVFRRGIK